MMAAHLNLGPHWNHQDICETTFIPVEGAKVLPFFNLFFSLLNWLELILALLWDA